MRKASTLIIGGTAILGCMIFTGCGANKMADALETKDIAQISEVYYEADGNEKLLSKYDETIGAYIEQMSSDLNNYDFDTSASEMGEAAVYEYSKNNWNDLMLPDSDNSLIIVINDATQEQWEYLQEIYISKIYYCEALYDYKVNEDFENAIQYFWWVSENDAKYSEIPSIVDECANAYVDSLEIEVNDSTTEAEMKEHLEQLSKASEFLDQYDISTETIQGKIVTCVDSYINIVLKNVDSDMESGDINAGLQRLQSAEEYLEEKNLISTEIEKKMAEVLTAYADEYAQKAAAAFKDQDAEAAVGNIEVAIKLQPDNAEYLDLRDTYEQYYPYALYDENNLLNAEYKSSEWAVKLGDYEFHDSIKGNDNNDYMNIIEIETFCHSALLEMLDLSYNLAGKYDVISGKILIPQIDKSTSQSAYFEAYGDGKLLYTSPTMQPGVLPQDISFGVSGVQNLELKFYGSSSTLEWPGVALSNFVAQKKFPE